MFASCENNNTSSSNSGSSSTGGSNSGGGETSTNKKYDNEKTSVTFSVGELDGVFNPFFSTSAYDGEIVGLTQISMLSSDANGAIAYGRDEPVMTLDYKQTMYDANHLVTTSGSSDGTTEYEFLIKNGVKDSAGYDITIKDILFNIYVYLDPVYNGSSTMYSTDIQGLNDYKTGIVGSNSEDANGLSTSALSKARATQQNIIAYANWKGDPNNSSYSDPTQNDADTQAQYEAYIEKLYSLFDDMLETDWKSCVNSMETAKENYILVDATDYNVNKNQTNPKTYEISSTWEYFCIEEGLCQYVKVGDSYKTDEETPRYYVIVDDGIQADIAGDGEDKAQEICFAAMKKEYKTYSQVSTLISGFSIGEEFLSYLQEIELGKINENDTVTNVYGITTYKTTEFNGVTYATSHDVLKITINGVDPKAIWNFAFTVAPMHYYASAEQIAAFDGVDHFGIIKKDTTYRDTYLKDSTKMGLPVGGGSYMASNASGNPTTSPTEFKSNNVVYYQRNPYFYTLGLDSATATQADLAKSESEADTAIHNAKIKYIRYQVVPSSSVLDNMITGAIDYSSDIGAKAENIAAINKESNLTYALQDNNGYGYIGINPKYVQDIEVRRLIMYAIDRQYITENYYTDGLGTIIERPMTTNSWAYPKGATTYYTQDWFIKHYKETYNKTLSATSDVKVFVENALKALGYSKVSGVYQKSLGGGITSKLDYTFTIAGETKDHPAYGVFQQVATDLDGVIKITPKTDALALSKLSNGQLAVWAAAWGSAIDPDMYQVYHKYSQATSVNNWGYSTILSDATGVYKTEQTIINTLSDLIDQGRSMLDQDLRAYVYSQALDTVMELAVELPTYQRSNLLVYNNTKIDPASLTPTSELTAYQGLIDKIWELDLL
jgi:peptide/nickel transport system substrate-binding protein